MKSLHRLLPLGLVAFALAGCASAPGPNCARLAFNGWFCLLPPSALAAREGSDLVKVTRAGKSEHYLGRLSITPARLELALMNLAGVPAATLVWDGAKARIRAPKKARAKLDPRQLAALLELTLAPPAKLHPALHGLALTVRHGVQGSRRRLSAGAKTVATAASAANGVTRIAVPRVKLTIVLKPLKSHE
jgi:hypothetical protein